jgi:dTDP-4-amino-4,6-dideoxygalactose transaminase
MAHRPDLRRPATLLPVARPRLPPARAIQPYLRQIDANAWYSNHGPLAKAFQVRLAENWGVPDRSVALLSNATTALTLAIAASGARAGTRCLMPSWTFVATACAVHQAGLVPHFVDVRADSWLPDPNIVELIAQHHDVGAIVIVSPFGATLDTDRWDALQSNTGIPVIIDAAAAFDTIRADGPMRLGACPMIVSLHATKVFGIGEGGALLSRDTDLVDRVRRLAQFGFLGTREALLPGLNAKLSEYAAAVGLAGLDLWQETRARWNNVTNTYMHKLHHAPIQASPGFGKHFVSSTLSVLWPYAKPAIKAELAEAGIDTLRWWGPGCHAQPSFRHCPAEPLPVTDDLAARTIGLPFWQDLTPSQIDTACLAVSYVAERHAAAEHRASTLAAA